MSEDTCANDQQIQIILLVISLGFHVFQAFVTGIKMRVKCRDCSFSMRPKDSSPSPVEAEPLQQVVVQK